MSHLYVIAFGPRDTKIGISVQPVSRLRQLRTLGAGHVVESWFLPDAVRQVEAAAHKALRPWRIRISGQRERFAVGPDAACKAVELAILLAKEAAAEAAERDQLKAVALARADAVGALAPLATPAARYAGYVRAPTAREASAECGMMERLGVSLERVFVDIGKPGAGLRHAKKACEAGDALLVGDAGLIDAATLAALTAKGAAVQELRA